jgi:hypothetical protein
MLVSPILQGIPGIDHGFGNRDDDMAASFPATWPQRALQHERHGTHIAVIDHAGQDCGEADGMFTERSGVLLTIATADCAPILLARRDGSAVAARQQDRLTIGGRRSGRRLAPAAMRCPRK